MVITMGILKFKKRGDKYSIIDIESGDYLGTLLVLDQLLGGESWVY